MDVCGYDKINPEIRKSGRLKRMGTETQLVKVDIYIKNLMKIQKY